MTTHQTSQRPVLRSPAQPGPTSPSSIKNRALGIALAAAVGLLGSLSVSAQQQTPVRGGTLVAAVNPAPTQMNTTFHNQYANAVVSSNIYDGLFSYDDKQNRVPVLATGLKVSPDGLAITIALRKGVKWHDGVEFTSADVRYSFLEVLQKVHPRGRVTFAAIKDVETPDKYTAILRLDRPAPVILSALNTAEAQILPKHLYEGTDVRTNPQNAKPIGTGPFRFKEWKKGQYVELERNPDYWDKGKPYLDRVIFRQIADPATRAAALETGEIQYLPFAGVPFSDVARLRARPDLAFDQRGYAYNAQIYYVAFNLKRAPFDNVKVRQAIAHALDKQGLINTVWYGLSQPADGPVPKALSRFFTNDKPKYAFDRRKAEQLLDEAGLPRKEGGIRFSFELELSPSGDAFVPAGEYIRQNLRAVGIDVRPKASEPSSYLKKVWTNYEFDAIVNGFSTLFDPEMGLTRLYWSKAVSPGVPYITAWGYENAEIDKVIEGYQKESDDGKRVKLFHQLQQIALRDLPLIPIMDAPFFTLYSKKLHGIDFGPDGSRSSFRDAWLSK